MCPFAQAVHVLLPPGYMCSICFAIDHMDTCTVTRGCHYIDYAYRCTYLRTAESCTDCNACHHAYKLSAQAASKHHCHYASAQNNLIGVSLDNVWTYLTLLGQL